MTHCRVEQDLAKHLAEEEVSFGRMDAIEAKEKDVEEEFTKRAKGVDGIEDAFHWLGGVFNNELMSNAISYLFGDGSNLAFEEAVSAKAEELLDADWSEPDAPDYDDER